MCKLEILYLMEIEIRCADLCAGEGGGVNVGSVIGRWWVVGGMCMCIWVGVGVGVGSYVGWCGWFK